jgi:O-antigen/teichoic acid export membrane protein
MSGLARRLVRNTFSTAAAYTVSLALSLLLTPYMLAVLGVERFGVWVILAVAVTYFSLLDLGIGTAFIKHLSDAQTRGEAGRRNEILSTGWCFYALFGTVVLGGGVAVQQLLLRTLNVPPDALHVYWGVLAIFTIRSMFMVYRSMLFALQRLEVLNGIVIATAALNALLTVAVLAAGYGLTGLVLASLLVAGVHVAAETTMAYRCCPGLRMRITLASLQTFKPLFRYGIQIQASKFAELVHLHIDKLLLSHFLGLTHVTMYELGAKIAGLTRSFPTVLLPAVLPVASELEAKQDRRRLRRLYEQGSKYLVVLVFPMVMFVLLSSETIMNAWLGPGVYPGAALALRVLAVAYMFYLLTGMGTAVARGIGAVHHERIALITGAILNVALSSALVVMFGLKGVLAATACSMVVGYAIFTIRFHQHMDISLMSHFKSIYAIPLSGAVVAGVVLLALGYPTKLLDFQVDHHRSEAMGLLLMQGGVYLLVYIGVVLKARYVAADDWRLVRKAFVTSLEEQAAR